MGQRSMGLIPNETVREVLERVDVLQVVSEYVQLKKAGTNYKGLCPFHSEKTPSFNVNPTKGFFKCFGCGEGGDALTFLRTIEGWTFPEAVRHLAGRYNIPIPEVEDKEYAQRQRQRDAYNKVLTAAQEYYEAQMWGSDGQPARDYLKARGVDEETAKTFGLGFALPSWSGLLDALTKRGVAPKQIEAAGLVLPGKRGHYDRFRGRLTFPVFDLFGQVLAFSARVIPQFEDPDFKGGKYINSPETAYYKKGKQLFGLYSTRGDIKSLGEAVLVEGNFDVVTLYAQGVRNAVAPLGTALTSQQIALLGRYTKRVVVAFDGDSAGVAATLKSMPELVKSEFDARVMRLEDGEDPDSLIRDHGEIAYRQREKRRRPHRAVRHQPSDWPHRSRRHRKPRRPSQRGRRAARMCARPAH